MKSEDSGKTVIDYLRERIELLETRLRHMQNDYAVTRSENDIATRKYMEILANQDHLVTQRTTELEESKRVLEQKSSELQIMLDSTLSLFMLVDRQGRFVRVNQTFARFLELAADEITGHTIEELLPDMNPEFTMHNRYVLESGQALAQREEGFYTGAERRRLLIDRKPRRAADGAITGVVCCALDITDMRREENLRRQLERRVSQTQKMEAIGALAGGIAHDFNNILSVILGYADLINHEDKTADKMKKHAAEIACAGTRARDLVRQILAFSRRGEMERRPLLVGNIVKEVLRLIRASVPTTIEIKQNIVSRAVVLADATQIHQVIMNLCANAAQAMRGKHGVLTVELRDYSAAAAPEQVRHSIHTETLMRLRVQDTGCGMAREVRDRIFEPYYTTKKAGEGSGMGLAIVHGIISETGGIIEVESEPGKGSSFDIWLPVLQQAADAYTEESRQRPSASPAHLLLVDDELQIVRMLQESLENYGYTITVRTGGIEALELFRNEPLRFDAVVTDMTMPGLNGVELAREIGALRPGLPVVVCSGYSEGFNEARVESERHVARVLLKPVITAQLVVELEHLLHRAQNN